MVVVVTLSLQSLATLFGLAIGIVALAVARHREAFPEMHWLSWRITGVAFVLIGSSAVLHAGAALWAFRAGAGSVVYDTYIRWSPVGNHGRTLVVMACACLLLWVTRTRASSPRRLGPALWGLLLLAMVTGGAIGWWEGYLLEARHWSSFAFLNSLALLVMLVALFGAFLARTMDWHLWLALLIFALHLSLNVIWTSALAWIRIPGAWSPAPWQIHLYAAAAYAIMVAIALHRLVLARRGVQVASALDFLAPARSTSRG